MNPDENSGRSHSVADAPTAGTDYAERLRRLQGARWKQWLDVQAPYRWHVRHLDLGRVLDLGCGIGRNLVHLHGNGVGVDHNAAAVKIARSRGLVAYETTDWMHAPEAQPDSFDSMLVAHVLEHLDERDGENLIRSYSRFIKLHGKFVFITPQERGYASDATHIRFVGLAEIRRLCEALGLVPILERSFPFPRHLGRLFKYNEFVVVAQRL